MDPLFAAGTLTSLLQLVQSTVDAFQQIKDLPQELHRLMIEVVALREVLLATSKLPIHAESDRLDKSLQAVIFSCQSTLESILHEHAKIADERSRRIKTWRYLLVKDRLERLRRDLDRHKATFSVILSGLAHVSATAAGSNLDAVQQKLSRLQDLSLQQLLTYENAIQKQSARQLRNQILDWVSTYDYQAAHARKASQRLAGTCEWFIHKSPYVDWKRAPNSSLVVFGMPGVGKSVLCSRVVDDLQSTSASGLAYFYVTLAEPLSFEKVLGSLSRQLLEQSTELPGPIVSAYESKKGLPADRSTLGAIFGAALRALPQATVVLDGFDEIDPDTGSALLTFISGLHADNLRWMIFSRYQPIVHKFAQNELQLDTWEYPVNHDIQLYIHSRLSNNRHLLSRPEELERLEHAIAAKASGMFLWVELILGQLQRQTSVKDMRLSLDRLPTALKDYYDLEWRQLGQSDQTAVALTALSTRPLTVRELESLVNQFSTTEEISEYGSWTFVPNAFIPRVHGDGNVQLLHFSIIDYVKSAGLLSEVQISALAQLLESTEKLEPQALSKRTAGSPGAAKPMANDEDDDAEGLSEKSSLYSYSTSVFTERSSPVSQTSVSSILSQLETVTNQYAKLFINNDDMKPLILHLLDRNGQSGFEELFCKLLREYSEALKSVAISTAQQVAAIMAGDRAVPIAWQLVLISGYLDTSKVPLSDASEAEKEGKLLLLERFLGQGTTPEQSPNPEVERVDMKSPSQSQTKIQATRSSHLPAATENERPDIGLEVEPEGKEPEVYVNLEAIKVWLTAGAPFQKLLNEMKNSLRTPIIVLPDPPSAKNSSETSEKEIAATSWQKLRRGACKALLQVLPGGEEPLQPVMKRVRWTCYCGISFCDDFYEIQPGAVARIQKCLNDQYRAELEVIKDHNSGVLLGPLPWIIGLVVVLLSGLSLPTYLEWSALLVCSTLCLFGFSLSIFVLLIGLLLSSSVYEMAVQETCDLHDLSDLGTSNNRSQDGPVSLYDEPNENNQPVDNDTQCPTARGSSKSARTASQNDSHRSSQLPQRPKTSKSKGKEPVRDESPPRSPSLETSTRRRGVDFNRDGLWVLGLFDNRIGHLIYAHLNARTRRTDYTLFSGLRKKYYRASSLWHRFSRLRQVSAVRVVRFNITDMPPNASADIHEYDVWPPNEESGENKPRVWIYAKVANFPPIGSRQLIETWRNPHHADKKAYARFRRTAKWNVRLVEWLRQTPILYFQRLRQAIAKAGALDDPYEPTFAFDGVIDPNLTPAVIHHTDEEQPEQQPRSDYIITRIPKKVGEQLIIDFPAADSPDDNPIVYPEGWGLFLQEKFYVHRFLFFVLLLYSMFCILVLVLYGCKQLNPQKPPLTESEITTIYGLVLSYTGFATTLWFKWSENL